MPDLDPTGNPVYLGDVVVRSPGLRGIIERYEPTNPAMRGIDNSSEVFQEALGMRGIDEQFTLEISEQSETADGSGGSRASGGTGDIELSIPGPGDGYAQVVLYTAEDGSVSWHFPRDIPPAATATRGGEQRQYTIPRVIAPSSEESTQRGLFGVVGRKLIKVLSFAVGPIVGALAGQVAAHWETGHHLDAVRGFGVSDYQRPAAPLTEQQWRRLAAGRALLFVHGTISRSYTGFGSLRRAVMQQLSDRYDGRVFAFDHSTVSRTPTQNAEWFLGNIPPGLALDVDVVSHSRGGLVTRALDRLTATSAGSGGGLTIGTVVMVATPNAGTALVDGKNLEQFLNRYTSFFQLLPDNAVTDTIGVLLALVQQVALDALRGLSGLVSMDPNGSTLPTFNGGPTGSATYHAVASDYEPIAGTPLSRVARDGLTDLVFGRAPNDLVVPTDGVYTVPQANGFPIAEPLIFDASYGVDHSTYWTQPLFEQKLLEWLPAFA